ncbi:hypothetical protein [Microbacterium sp. GXS0129]|uniref:hypothetical protein n=1 Tax=Microbacterium sp. GXS0129 TaxID=3377836 RepID=UPI00383AF7CD
MITAEKVGRNLHLTVEGIDEPYVVRPLPGAAGLQITDTYLNSMGGDTIGMAEALQIAFDGARENAITGRWEPLPEAEQSNYRRMGRELSQSEAETVLMPAFFWQTILGIDGVTAYIEGGEGLAGTLKASAALTSRLGTLARRTSPSTASAG